MAKCLRKVGAFVLALAATTSPRQQHGAMATQAIDRLSLLTTRVILTASEEERSLGTGFFYETEVSEGQRVRFLVTNVHVLTGHPPGSSESPVGDAVNFFCHTDIERPGEIRRVTHPVFASNGEPVFLTSSSVPEADVAMIPLPTTMTEGCQIVAARLSDSEGDMFVRPGTNATLVGYPYGFFDEVNHLPVWKTGAIASEPDVDFGGLPLFLVDVSAFPGMSGSPVLTLSSGPYQKRGGGTVLSSGQVRMLLGVFSAMQVRTVTDLVQQIQAQRLGVERTESLELGVVWKFSVVAQIAANFDVTDYQARVLRYIR